MKLTRVEFGWIVKLWVFATVFVIWFLGTIEVIAWVAFGAVLGLVWRSLPEGEEKPVEPLPYAQLYKDREVPRRGAAPAAGTKPPESE